MSIIHYKDASEAPVDEILSLFLKIDRNAQGNTYDKSTVSISQSMFFDEDENIEPKEALRVFYTKFAEEVVVYRQGQPVGFTMFKSNSYLFEQELPAYMPHLAIIYSGVHPNYQREGVWTAIRDTIYNIAEKREIPYILTGVDAENKVSLGANKSRGFVVVGETKTVDGTENTILLSRRLTSSHP